MAHIEELNFGRFFFQNITTVEFNVELSVSQIVNKLF